jgi:malate dehydrogenase (oxaloacetate-decarboxylating)
MLHWEDLGASNARRVLRKYQDTCCTFNDDMQGTAAVVLAAALAALRLSGTRMRDHTVVIHGAGTAGIGIADMMRDLMIAEGLSPDEATARFYAIGSKGLISDDQAALIRDFQVPYARPASEVAGWAPEGSVAKLADVVREVHPTMLIGTSAQPASFTESLVREMAAHCERPVIMPLSNPTSKCEALPSDLLAWTDGRALIATGSPFAPVEYGGQTYTIAQANNALVFPGLGLGQAVARASRITDGMLVAAADAVAKVAVGTGPGAPLLPPVESLRKVSAAVAIAVTQAAEKEGLAQADVSDLVQQVHQAMWRPAYPAIVPI